MPIDESVAFRPVRIAVLTISDTRTEADDRSGDTLVALLTEAGHILADRAIVPDDADMIVARFHAMIDDDSVDCVIATGGTGVTGRDVTPEAVERVCDKLIPGFGELFRMLSFEQVGAAAMLSRATAGTFRGKVVVSTPGV